MVNSIPSNRVRDASLLGIPLKLRSNDREGSETALAGQRSCHTGCICSCRPQWRRWWAFCGWCSSHCCSVWSEPRWTFQSWSLKQSVGIFDISLSYWIFFLSTEFNSLTIQARGIWVGIMIECLWLISLKWIGRPLKKKKKKTYQSRLVRSKDQTVMDHFQRTFMMWDHRGNRDWKWGLGV